MKLLGLAAAAIPALLHLRQRQTPPTIVFPAVRYLQETKKEQSRRLKLRNLLLLILRTLIIILIILAAARPVATVNVGGVHAPTAMAVVVDNSLSSGVVLGGRRLSDVLVQRARGVIDRTGESDHLWLTLADGVPRRMTRIDAGKMLDSVAPSPVRLDLGQAARSASEAIADDLLPGHEVVVVSDLQASAFSGGAVPRARVMFWQPPATVENRGIDSARAEPAGERHHHRVAERGQRGELARAGAVERHAVAARADEAERHRSTCNAGTTKSSRLCPT